MVFQNNVLSGAAGSGTTTHAIDQSIRFDDAAEHYMYSPAPSSSKDFTTTATISMWIKLGNIGQHYFAGAFYGSNARYDFFQINANNKLQASGRSGGASTATGSGVTKWITTQVFRDPSAWYHLIFVYDTTNAVQSERFRLYINGERVTEFDTAPSYGASELVYWFGKSSYTTLGAYFNQTGYADYFYWDGYMAEMHGVDGTALDPDSFGEFNSSGIWTPKEYTGSHGTDGFYIKGADASDLGTNSAANGNDFTLNGISSHDKMLDSPTNNYCVISPLDSYLGSTTWSQGNLQIGGASNITSSSISVTSGKWYVEVRKNANADNQIGVMSGQTNQPSAQLGTSQFRRAWRDNNNSPQFLTDDSTSGSGTAESLAAGDILGIALDLDNDAIYFADNNTWMNSGDPTSGASKTGAIFTDLNLHDEWRWFTGSNSLAVNNTWNFGQDGTFAGTETAQGNTDGNGHGNFYYAPPSGYLAVNTKNLGS